LTRARDAVRQVQASGSREGPEWQETVAGGHDCHWQRLLLEEVDITRLPYTTRYPELAGFMAATRPNTGWISRSLGRAGGTWFARGTPQSQWPVGDD
jgi:hypothetical protein